MGCSQRSACAIVGVSRSAFNHSRKQTSNPQATDKYADLRAWLVCWAASHPRWGYRRTWVKAREEGFDVGRDVIRRLWRQEGLRVMPRKRKKRRTLPEPTPQGAARAVS
ncbi:IS3 family transposase [Corynebacterium glucuronolyticum]